MIIKVVINHFVESRSEPAKAELQIAIIKAKDEAILTIFK